MASLLRCTPNNNEQNIIWFFSINGQTSRHRETEIPLTLLKEWCIIPDVEPYNSSLAPTHMISKNKKRKNISIDLLLKFAKINWCKNIQIYCILSPQTVLTTCLSVLEQLCLTSPRCLSHTPWHHTICLYQDYYSSNAE